MKRNRLIAFILSLIMLIGSWPEGVFAAEMEQTVEVLPEQTMAEPIQPAPAGEVLEAVEQPAMADMAGLVNTFSDSLLSSDTQGRVIVTIQPFHRRQIAEVLLNTPGVVEAMDIRKNTLSGFLPGGIAAVRMDQFPLQNREEAFAPGIVTRFSGAGETLPQAQLSQQLPYGRAGVLAAAV